MKKFGIVLMVLALVAAGWAGLGGFPEPQAGGGPGAVVYKDTKSFAPVTFDHAQHKDAGAKCGHCHDALFQKKAGSADEGNALTMKSLRDGKFCGACHNGSKAFTVRGSCKKCHQK